MEAERRLEADPRDGLADAPFSIRVLEAPANQAITLTAVMKDAKGHRWQSHGVFNADVNGIVNLKRDAPASGTYDGVDASGLIWSMRFASPETAPCLFAPSPDHLGITFSAEPGSGTAAAAGDKTVAVRRWRGARVTRSELQIGPSAVFSRPVRYPFR